MLRFAMTRQLLCVLSITGAVGTGHAATPAQRCAATEVRAAGRTVYTKMRCYRDAVGVGTEVDAACLTMADQKLSRVFAKADAAGGCTGTGNASTTRTAVDACLTSFLRANAGDAKCVAAKMAAIGAKAYADAKCRLKAFLRDSVNPDPSCLSKAEMKFAVAVARADLLGSCTDTATALKGLVDVCVSSLVSSDVLFPRCTNPYGSCGETGWCFMPCVAPVPWDGTGICIDTSASGGACTTEQDCAAFPGTRCVDLNLLEAGCGQRCVAPAGTYTCAMSDAPSCGGTCPTGQVCGQVSGQSSCTCAPPDDTCSIAQAPTCGGTCPGGVCTQVPGGNSCACAPPDNTCSIAQAPTCGGTCSNGEVCAPMGSQCGCPLRSCGSPLPSVVVLEQGGGDVPAGLIGIDPLTGNQCSVSSGGFLSNAIGENPNGVTLDPSINQFLVVDRAGQLVSVDVGTGAQALVASDLPGDPTAIAVESPGRLLIATYSGSLLRFHSTTKSVSVVASGGLIGGVSPSAIQMHPNGDAIVSALTAGGNDVPGPPSRVIRIDPSSGAQTLIAEITDGQFRDFALADTYAFIAISSRGYPTSADRVSKLDLVTGQLTPIMSGFERVLDVDFAPDHSLFILDQLLTHVGCCPPWVPVVYSAPQDGSTRRIVAQGGSMFVPSRLVVLP